MRGGGIALCLGLAVLAAPAARAGEARCFVENGAVIVPAALGDIAGDFLLDLGAPASQLHNTIAEAWDVEGASDVAPLQLAGERVPAASFQVADLDARSWGFSTTLNGLIAADVLQGYVVDLQLEPCRLTLWPGPAPARRVLARWPLAMVGGAPAVAARVTDGKTVLNGWFAIDTGTRGV